MTGRRYNPEFDRVGIKTALAGPLQEIKKQWADYDKGIDAVKRCNYANLWPIVTLLYSGLEQSLKAVVLAEKHPEGLRGDKRRKTLRDYGHDLKDVWTRGLSAEARGIIEDHWQEFRALYRFGEIQETETVETFLEGIGGQHGYMRWRYSLIEDVDAGEPPRISVQGMMELWGSAASVYGAKIRRGKERPGPAIRGPLERIEGWASDVWQWSHSTAAGCSQKVLEEIEMRAEKAGGYANLTAEVLWRKERGLRLVDGGRPVDEYMENVAEAVARRWNLWGERQPEWEEEPDWYWTRRRVEPNLREWHDAAIWEGIELRLGEENPGQRAVRETKLAEGRSLNRIEGRSGVRKIEAKGTHAQGWALQGIRNELYGTGWEVTEHRQVERDDNRWHLLLTARKPNRNGRVAKVEVWRRETKWLEGRVTARLYGEGIKKGEAEQIEELFSQGSPYRLRKRAAGEW